MKMFNLIGMKPQKGKAFDNLPTRSRHSFYNDMFAVSTKFDGNQIFIVKQDTKVRCFTSDWKEFNTLDVDGAISAHNKEDFILIGEFMYNSLGKLGDRRKSAILTTWRTDFNKKISSKIDTQRVNIKIFDAIIGSDGFDIDIINRLNRLNDRVRLPSFIDPISYTLMSGTQAIQKSQELIQDGWEGAMAIQPKESYKIGKRVNYSVKLKRRKTADLLCIDIVPGEGKYTNMIGALVLEDAKGRVVNVGSGLDDRLRSLTPEYFLGRIIEIEYEQLIDTYIQPTFTQVRFDKTVWERD